MNKSLIVIIVSVIMVLVGIFIFFKYGPTSMNNSNSTVSSYATADDNGMITIELSDFSFKPNGIEISAGSSVKVKLTNKNGNHDFVIDELGVKSNVLNSGEEQTITIRAPESSAGMTYQFYCSQEGHRAMGMVGSLKVN